MASSYKDDMCERLKRPVDLADNQPGFLVSLLPKVPLIIRTTILHLLGYTKRSEYLDLRTELITTVLRSYMTPDVPISITATQRHLVKEIRVKGRIWISKYACPAPLGSGIQDAIAAAIEGLRDRKDEVGFKMKMPDTAPVEAEWTGYRARANEESRLPDISEREKYDEMMKEVTRPTTILYLHGGAFWVMDPGTHRATTKVLAKLTGGRCYSVRYRLSPKHKFPAALMDALVSYLALLYPPPGAFHEAVPAEHVVFAGDSAGGNLCLSLVQTLLHLQRTNTPVLWQGKQRSVPLPAGVAVNSPWMDITHSMPSCDSNGDYDYLPSLQEQLAFEPVRRHCGLWPSNPPRTMIYADDNLVLHPLVSLLLVSSWAGAPPVWICTGRELFTDEDKFTAKKFWQDGVPVVYDEFEGMPHCFALLFPQIPEGRRCLNGWAGFAKKAVEGGREGVETKFRVVKAKTLEEIEVDPEGLSAFTVEEVREMITKRLAVGVVRGLDMKAEAVGVRALAKL